MDRTSRFGTPARVSLLAVLLALLLAACTIEVRDDDALVEPEPVEELEDPEARDLEVELAVVEGPRGSTLAFVPVFINDEGPFRFALDTGASDSVVHADVAEQLGLELGDTQPVAGVTGVGEAATVEIEDWRAAGVPLPAGSYSALDMPTAADDTGFEGLLGSDVLSTFGAITVDYEREVLILRPRQ